MPSSLEGTFKHNFNLVAEKIVSLAKQKKKLPAECYKLFALMDDGGDGDDDDADNDSEYSQGIKLPVHSISKHQECY